jgi:mannitol-1-phosphate 5-dehydrogenase
VIGKMSRTVTGTLEVAGSALAPIAPGLDRAFLVEKFNRIFVDRCIIDDFKPGIGLFVEKDDLLPYEEAKLYGHNAIHALLGYLGIARGYENMTELGNDKELLRIARTALYNESGAALIRKHAGIDELFTKDGHRRYAEDLLARIMNPWLGDTLERAARNVVRKLGCRDRLFGTMSLALDRGIRPVNMALGAVAALHYLLTGSEQTEIPEDLRFRPSELAKLPTLKTILAWIWPKEDVPQRAELIELVHEAFPAFMTLLK